jgi:drug/metabolite transporter (DMT)-like permease
MDFNPAFIPYSLGFAAAYATGTVFFILAISCGPLSISSLMTSYSLIIPTLYGLVFLRDPISIGLIPGIILLLISLFLINVKNEKVNISLKWVIYITLAFIGNGMCTVVQKMEQIRFEGKYKNEFMIVALITVAIFMTIMALIKERKSFKTNAKLAVLPAAASGLLNGTVNLFVMILSGSMPASLMFPLISAGGIILTFFVSTFLYKERLSPMQIIGVCVGVVSVVLLNI